MRSSIKQGLLVASVVSLAALSVDRMVLRVDPGSAPIKKRASLLMIRALECVREVREREGPPLDVSLDPNRSGLIGVESSEITTTLGDLEAKRTATNPAMAALMVQLFEEAGLKQGDLVGVGCSGSFPGLFVAVLAAAEAMALKPVIIISLGSSSYGANQLPLTLLDVSVLLNRCDVLSHTLAGASLGGSGDMGREFDPEVRDALIAKIRSAGIPWLSSSSVRESVRQRLQIYGLEDGGTSVKAFVNIGGGAADMGLDPWILTVGPGLHRHLSVPDTVGQRGVLLEMASRGVPVIHLLYLRGLIDRYQLVWDPVPFSGMRSRSGGLGFWVLVVMYAVLVIGSLLVSSRPRGAHRGD